MIKGLELARKSMIR